MVPFPHHAVTERGCSVPSRMKSVHPAVSLKQPQKDLLFKLVTELHAINLKKSATKKEVVESKYSISLKRQHQTLFNLTFSPE